MSDLPFDPETIPVHTEDGSPLADALAEIEDEDTVHRLQKRDTRRTAAAHYERRVDEIRAARVPPVPTAAPRETVGPPSQGGSRIIGGGE